MTWSTEEEGGQRPLFGESQTRFDETMFRTSDTPSIDTTSPTHLSSRKVETINTTLDDISERTLGAAALPPVLRPYTTGYAEKYDSDANAGDSDTDPTPPGLSYSA